MNKKLVIGIVAIVIIVIAFIGSTLYINNIHKTYYETLTQANIKDTITEFIHSYTKEEPRIESLLFHLNQMDMTLESQPYESGFFHSKGAFTINGEGIPQISVSINFCNIPFLTSYKITFSSTEMENYFHKGEIGVLEINGNKFTWYFNDVATDEQTLILKDASLEIIHNNKQEIKKVIVNIGHFSSLEYNKFDIKNLSATSTYEKSISYSDILNSDWDNILTSSQHSKLTLDSLTLAKYGVNIKKLKLSSTSKINEKQHINFSGNIDFKSLTNFIEDGSDETLDITDFTTNIQGQDIPKEIIQYLEYINNPFIYTLLYGEEYINEILTKVSTSNAALFVKDASFLFNGKKLTYIANANFGDTKTFYFKIMSKFSAQELLEHYENIYIKQQIGELFVPQEDSKEYAFEIKYQETQDSESLFVNGKNILAEEYIPEDDEDMNLDIDENLDTDTIYNKEEAINP